MRFSTYAAKFSRRKRIFSKTKEVHQRKILNGTWIMSKSTYSGGNTAESFPVKNRYFRRGDKKDFVFSGSFHEAITPVLLLAQIFGLMPVSGITSKTARDLKFSLRNFRTKYSFFALTMIGVHFAITWFWTLRQKFNFDSIETLIFYTMILLMAVSFFNLSRVWPKLMTQWEEVESHLQPYSFQLKKRELAHKIKMIMIVMSLLSLAEHILSMLSAIYYTNACPVRSDPIESFLFISLNQIFFFFEYNNWLAVFGKYLNILATFTWSFTDIFIMVISVGLSSKFRQFNEALLESSKKPTTGEFWNISRVNYGNLCQLCRKVDDAISFLTLLCFANDLFFICAKIMKSLQAKPSFTHSLYFWFSLFYVMGRTLAVSLYSAAIHDESRRPLDVIRSVPQEFWGDEIKRFSHEVSSEVVALTGMKFFYLTRHLILSVAGTVVTYELVLLQFHKDDKINDCM